ncbi:Hypothetical protein PENO1_111950 [Penicillium occitanis (nom. inval.)]|nr:Hypothetical protein PENO1_111950 [Penicillium occitanis (nom. inval.)]PCG88172.1 hypothetical protein PENOC_112190 [Penicillium occitanis (nom. inval.)]
MMSGQPPFKLSGTKLLKNYGFRRPEKYLERRPTSVPFDFLRLRLYQAEMPEGVVSTTKEIIFSKLNQLPQVPVALITNDGMLFFHDDEMLALQSIIYQPPGSRFYQKSHEASDADAQWTGLAFPGEPELNDDDFGSDWFFLRTKLWRELRYSQGQSAHDKVANMWETNLKIEKIGWPILPFEAFADPESF